VAEVQRAGWAIAGEDGWCVHKDSLKCSCRKGSYKCENRLSAAI
jgi:hypothetical protein